MTQPRSTYICILSMVWRTSFDAHVVLEATLHSCLHVLYVQILLRYSVSYFLAAMATLHLPKKAIIFQTNRL